MSFVVASTDTVLDAARNLASLNSTISGAHAAASTYTTDVLAAAGDEVSMAIASCFSDYASAYQALGLEATAFHTQLVQTLNAAAEAYAAVESVNATALQNLEQVQLRVVDSGAVQAIGQNVLGLISAPTNALIGRPLIGTGPATTSSPGYTINLQSLGSQAQMGLPAAAGDIAIIMGPSGFPVPPPLYVKAAIDDYIHQFFPGAIPLPLTTPEGLYPVTGVNTLPLDSSVKQGVATLDNAIMAQIAAGHHVDVFGYSQSSLISSIEMSQLAANHVPPQDVSFILVGDPVNPNGGFLTRFNIPYPLGGTASFPALGVTLSGATPSDLYPTQIFTKEYDGFADFPRYPINVLSDLNAYLGIVYDHATYLNPTPGSQTIDLGTYGQTTYYMITDPSLPLLDPLRVIPGVGKPLYDLLEPDTRILVNLGYGSIYDGWDTQNLPNVTTPFGLFPTNIDPTQLTTALANGAQQGFTAAGQDLQNPSLTFDWSSLQGVLGAAYTFGLTPTYISNPLGSPSDLLDLINAISTFAHGDVPISAGNFLDALTGAVSNGAATGLPVLGTALTVGISLPQYDANLFLDGLASGDLLAAIGDPIAADVALVPFAITVGAVIPIVEAGTITISEFASLIP